MEKDDLLGGLGSIPKVDPRNYETIKCSNCGGIVFDTKYVLKRVSGMELGQGAKSMMVPLNVLVCANCGNILEDDIKGYKLEKDLETKKNNNSNLIIK